MRLMNRVEHVQRRKCGLGNNERSGALSHRLEAGATGVLAVVMVVRILRRRFGVMHLTRISVPVFRSFGFF